MLDSSDPLSRQGRPAEVNATSGRVLGKIIGRRLRCQCAPGLFGHFDGLDRQTLGESPVAIAIARPALWRAPEHTRESNLHSAETLLSEGAFGNNRSDAGTFAVEERFGRDNGQGLQHSGRELKRSDTVERRPHDGRNQAGYYRPRHQPGTSSAINGA